MDKVTRRTRRIIGDNYVTAKEVREKGIDVTGWSPAMKMISGKQTRIWVYESESIVSLSEAIGIVVKEMITSELMMKLENGKTVHIIVK